MEILEKYINHIKNTPIEVLIKELEGVGWAGEPKKYKLRHRFISTSVYDDLYINVDKVDGSIFLANETDWDRIQTKFTEEEIEEFKRKNKTDLSDFEIIEVE